MAISYCAEDLTAHTANADAVFAATLFDLPISTGDSHNLSRQVCITKQSYEACNAAWTQLQTLGTRGFV
jgi:hypothetical protein